MIKLQEIVGLPTLQYHLENKLTLSECVYRYSSDSFVQLFAEARQALRDGKIKLNEQDEQLIRETDIGEYGLYEGVRVPLDLPMVNEEYKVGETTWKDILSQLKRMGWTIEGWTAIKQIGHWTDQKRIELEYDNNGNVLWTIYVGGTVVMDRGEFDASELSAAELDSEILNYIDQSINEAEYQGKKVELGKPKRGGSKKFIVYVKDPKTKKVKKVQFGDSGNLKVKIDDPKARHAFAARHKCAQEKNRLSPNYWGCRIGRYWKSLGGSKNFSGYW